MKTLIWTKAVADRIIIVLLGLIFLAVLVSQLPSKEGGNLCADTALADRRDPPATAPSQNQANEELARNEAKRRAKLLLAFFDNARTNSERLVNFERNQPITADWRKDHAEACREVIRRARRYHEWIPEWQAVCQRVAEGDLSPSAIVAMDKARVEADRLWTEVVKSNDAFGASLQSPPGMTMEGYHALKPGMGMIDVTLALGCTGEEHLRAGSLTTWVWQQGSAQITVTFDHDKLVSKAQFGL